MNTIDALNIFYREDVISDFLKSCFEDSPAFLRQFLAAAHISFEKKADFQIINRLGLGQPIGTPDMVIVNGNQVIVIENKLGTGEGIIQTLRYESDLAKERLLHKLNMENASFHYIFLTLDTTVIPSSSNFHQIYYSEFLKNDWLLHDSTLHTIFNDFKEKLHAFYTPLEKPIETLSSNQILDSTQKKVCWQQIFMNAFKHHTQFTLDWGEVGGAGRNNFLFLLTKPSWKSAASYEETGIEKTFYIHVDTYINLLTEENDCVRDIGIRFETNPYVPHDRIKDQPGYAQFIANKNAFSERLFERLSKVLPESKKRNSKLLLATIPVETTSIATSVQDYQEKVALLEKLIDETVAEMQLF